MRHDYELFSRDTQCIVYGFQTRAVQRMLDFDYVCRRATPSVALATTASGPSSWIEKTPLPRLIEAASLSPSASVTVWVSLRSLANVVVRFAVSSWLLVVSCQMLPLAMFWVKVTLPKSPEVESLFTLMVK